jgi:hypothetical protein
VQCYGVSEGLETLQGERLQEHRATLPATIAELVVR